MSPPISRKGIRDPTFQAAWGLPRLWVSTGPGPPAWNPTQLEGVSHRALLQAESPWWGGEAPGGPQSQAVPRPPPAPAPSYHVPLAHTTTLPGQAGQVQPPGSTRRTGHVGPASVSHGDRGILAWPELPRGAFFSSYPQSRDTRRLCPIPALLRELGVGGGGVFPVGSGSLLGQAEGSAGCARGQSWPLTQP